MMKKKNISKIFLLPLIGIKRNIYIKNTYLEVEELFSLKHKVLVVEYSKITNKMKSEIYGNDNFLQEINNNIYVFKIPKKYAIIINKFIHGKYSEVNPKYKRMIINYWDKTSLSKKVNMYLYPEKFYKECSKEYEVDIELLKEVKELCSIPDFLNEKLMKKQLYL